MCGLVPQEMLLGREARHVTGKLLMKCGLTPLLMFHSLNLVESTIGVIIHSVLS